jgi:hypothetical protein
MVGGKHLFSSELKIYAGHTFDRNTVSPFLRKENRLLSPVAVPAAAFSYFYNCSIPEAHSGEVFCAHLWHGNFSLVENFRLTSERKTPHWWKKSGSPVTIKRICGFKQS